MTTLDLSYLPVPEKRHTSGFVEGLGLVTLSLLLLPAAMLLAPFVSTLLVSTLSLSAIAFAMHRKYRGRWQFNAEVAFVAGMAIQYLIAPLAIRIVSWDFTTQFFDIQVSFERTAVRDFYAHAMVIVLMFTGVYLVVSSMIPLKRTLRDITGELPTYFTKRTYFVYVLVIVMLWTSRAGLLAIGAFYHSHHVKFRDMHPQYSALIQFDSGMGPIGAAFLFAAALTRNLNWAVAGAYFIADFTWNFLSGSRERTVMPFIAMLLVYIVHRNRIPWKGLAIMLLPAILLMGFMDVYRQTVRRFADVDRISFTQVMQALVSARDRSESVGLGATFIIGMGRISDLEPIAEVYRNVPDVQPYLMGETYERIPASLVPRALWPDKPVVSFGINEWFFRHEGGSSPLTVMGEGYLNYGWFGVVLAAIVIAIMLRLMDRFMLRSVNNIAVLPVYMGFVALSARLHTQSLSMWIGGFIKLIGVAIVMHLLTKRFGEHPATVAVPPEGHGLPADGTPPPEYARNGRAAHAQLH